MKKPLILLSLMTVLLSPLTYAEERPALAINAGTFDAFDDETAAEVGIEYRFAPLTSFYAIIPAVGISITSDGSYWAHAGIRYDWQISPNWVITPHTAVVGYEQGGGYDMGYDLLFRNGVEIAYQFSTSRVGLGIYHMSNGGMGDGNPGEESVYLSYSMLLNN